MSDINPVSFKLTERYEFRNNNYDQTEFKPQNIEEPRIPIDITKSISDPMPFPITNQGKYEDPDFDLRILKQQQVQTDEINDELKPIRQQKQSRRPATQERTSPAQYPPPIILNNSPVNYRRRRRLKKHDQQDEICHLQVNALPGHFIRTYQEHRYTSVANESRKIIGSHLFKSLKFMQDNLAAQPRLPSDLHHSYSPTQKHLISQEQRTQPSVQEIFRLNQFKNQIIKEQQQQYRDLQKISFRGNTADRESQRKINQNFEYKSNQSFVNEGTTRGEQRTGFVIQELTENYKGPMFRPVINLNQVQPQTRNYYSRIENQRIPPPDIYYSTINENQNYYQQRPIVWGGNDEVIRPLGQQTQSVYGEPMVPINSNDVSINSQNDYSHLKSTKAQTNLTDNNIPQTRNRDLSHEFSERKPNNTVYLEDRLENQTNQRRINQKFKTPPNIMEGFY